MKVFEAFDSLFGLEVKTDVHLELKPTKCMALDRNGWIITVFDLNDTNRLLPPNIRTLVLAPSKLAELKATLTAKEQTNDKPEQVQ